MKVISLVTQKGGSGKSTLCISLAVAAKEAGYSVCILEMDKQATVTQWRQERSVAEPEVGQIDAARLEEVIGKLQGAEYDYVFLDTPGIDSPGTTAAVRVADLCLIPCRPSPADLRGVKPTLATVHRLGKEFAFVLTQTPPKSYRVRDTAEGLKVLGMISDVSIVMRNDHQDAIGTGLGVTELNPEGQAADEIRRLWAWVQNRTKDIPHAKVA